MGGQVKMREYLEQNKGYACVRLNFVARKEALLGLNKDGKPFYFTRHRKTGELAGPYMFGLADEKIQSIMDYELKKSGTIIENIPEGVLST